MRDHPRSRGVYWVGAPHRRRRLGSSPLARGLRRSPTAGRSTAGIIPARAGFTWRAAIGGRSSMDHPRSRGVYGLGAPHRRGRSRIIPARAGFTWPRRGPARRARDHPRSRGVYERATCTQAVPRGSSPLARGLPVETTFTRPSQRIIPARAGFTSPHHHHPTSNEDHPRSRGVYYVASPVSKPASGSSPLARGLLS